MGDALSKPCEPEEPVAIGAAACEAAENTAGAAPASATRRRVKVTPARLKQAPSSDDGNGSSSSGRAIDGASAVAAGAAPPEQQRPNGAEQQQAPPVVSAAAAGSKRKAPDTAADATQETLSKRQQLLGLTILTLGALTGMAPFALPRRSNAGGAPPPEEPQPAEPAGERGTVQAVDQELAEEGPAQAAQHEAVQLTEQGPGQRAAGVVAAPAEAIQQLPEPCSPPAVRQPAGDVPKQQPEVQRQQEEAVPSQLADECAATPLPAAVQQHGSQEVGAELGRAGGHEERLPLSAAKPISRAQLRLQLQRQSQRSARVEASPGVRLAGGLAAGTPPSAGSGSGMAARVPRSTWGQRLLSLARQQQPRQPPAADAAQPAAEGAQLQPQPGSAAAEDGDQMQLDQPEAAAAPAELGEQPGVASGRPAQRRLTQSPFSRRPVAAGDSDAEPHSVELPSALMGAAPAETEQAPVQASPAAAGVSSPPSTATPPPQHASLPTSAAALPSAAPQGAEPVPDRPEGGHPSPDAPTRQPCSSAQSPIAHEGAVVAALHQVGALLVDLQAESSQPEQPLAGQPATEQHHPAAAEDGQPAARAKGPAQALPNHAGNAEEAGGAPMQREDAVQSTLKQQGKAQGPSEAPPCSPPEVCSRPQEAGADNFPGFWRPPAAGRPGSATSAAPAGSAAAASKPGRPRKRPAPGPGSDESGGEEQAPGGAQGRERRVRFSMPEPANAEAPAPAPAPDAALGPGAQQQPAAPTPLMVAPPVLPSSGSRGAARPGTPNKPVQLSMPQPPLYSRFGVASAVFRRPYSGPQGRRQALLSFVSESGATCFAVPPGVPVGADSNGGDVSADGPSDQQGSGLVIPRRLQHKEGQWRRRNQQPGFPSPQGPELLEQDVREAYMNAKLADHAGESWARLDMAGCELLPGSSHAETLAQVSSKLEAAQGTAAMKQLMQQLDAEWQHLKRMRQYATASALHTATQSASAAAPAAAAGAGAGAAPGVAASGVQQEEPAAKPRGILKHRSSLSGSGQLGAAAAAVAAEAETAAAAAVPAAAAAPASFEAVLAADIVQEPLPVASHPALLAPAAASAATGPPAAGMEVLEGDAAAALLMEVDAQAAGAAQGPPQESPPASVAPAAAPGQAQQAAAPAAGREASPEAADAGTQAASPAGEELTPQPRPVHLTPGPQLSRGAKMLQRLGTPPAAGKVQQLLQSAAAAVEQQGRRAASASPFAAPIKLLAAVRGSSGAGAGVHPGQAAQRHCMSRGERMLASIRARSAGTGAAKPAGTGLAVPHPGPAGQLSSQPAGAAGPGQPEGASSPPAEEGPTVAGAATVVLGA